LSIEPHITSKVESYKSMKVLDCGFVSYEV